MGTYDLLSMPIRRYVYKKGWPSFRRIQAAAIDCIMKTESNYILSAPTASGKTEAAFLPILSKTNFSEPGVQVLYISPLKALINDQFLRVEELCKDMEIPVTKWHGDANRTEKQKLLRRPEGIVLITPESIEAMFVNKPQNISPLFGSLRYVVIDEIHSFVGTERGVHLMSLLSRLQQINAKQIVTIGLSATVSPENYSDVKEITGNPENTKILLDRNDKETEVTIDFFTQKTAQYSVELIQELFEITKDSKSLIFPNIRGKTEEIAVRLQKNANKLAYPVRYFSHHSSIEKEFREMVEKFAKRAKYESFAIACTSTLELGIDIGSVDKAIQIDSAFSVASLAQRIGRCGRRETEKRNVYLINTNKWTLLQSLAIWSLLQEKKLDPCIPIRKPYDLLAHQIISIVKAESEILPNELLHKILSNRAFSNIAKEDVISIADDLVKKDYIEKVGEHLILGLKGEKVLGKDFYSAFSTPIMFAVYHRNKKIGELDDSFQIKSSERIYLAARIWIIEEVDVHKKRVYVRQAKEGKNPVYKGGNGKIHPMVQERMLQILINQYSFSEAMNPRVKEVFCELRDMFKQYGELNIKKQRPAIFYPNKVQIFLFSGTLIFSTLVFGFLQADIQIVPDARNCSIEFTDCTPEQYHKAMLQCKENLRRFDELLTIELEKHPERINSFKWAKLLDMKYIVKLFKERKFDVEGAEKFLNNFEFVEEQF